MHACVPAPKHCANVGNPPPKHTTNTWHTTNTRDIRPLPEKTACSSVNAGTSRACRDGQGADGKHMAGRHHPATPAFADASPATCKQAFVDEAFGYFRPGGEVGMPLPLPLQVGMADVRRNHRQGYLARDSGRTGPTCVIRTRFLLCRVLSQSMLCCYPTVFLYRSYDPYDPGRSTLITTRSSLSCTAYVLIGE